MALSRNSWLPLAEGLEVGQKRRVQHDCGEGRVLIVSRDPRRYSAFCFRCNDDDWSPGPQESLADRLKRQAALRDGDSALARSRGQDGPMVLPVPQVHVVSDWPVAAKLWLFKAGLGAHEIAGLGAYYHPPSDRVVLPVYEAGMPVFWQARALDGRQPKYMAPQMPRAGVVPRYGKAGAVTLCEDILSAFKVGLVAEGWSTMGTRLTERAIAMLLARRPKINVWLDPDERGQIGARKIIKQLRAYGLEPRNILSDRDPKLVTRQGIQEWLA